MRALPTRSGALDVTKHGTVVRSIRKQLGASTSIIVHPRSRMPKKAVSSRGQLRCALRSCLPEEAEVKNHNGPQVLLLGVS